MTFEQIRNLKYFHGLKITKKSKPLRLRSRFHKTKGGYLSLQIIPPWHSSSSCLARCWRLQTGFRMTSSSSDSEQSPFRVKSPVTQSPWPLIGQQSSVLTSHWLPGVAPGTGNPRFQLLQNFPPCYESFETCEYCEVESSPLLSTFTYFLDVNDFLIAGVGMMSCRLQTFSVMMFVSILLNPKECHHSDFWQW